MPGAWSCLPLASRPRNPAHTVGCKLAPRSPLNSQLPITGLADPRSAIRGSAESPSARPVARRHLGGQPQHTRTKREEGEGEEGGKGNVEAATGEGPGARRSSEHRHGSTLHGFRCYTAATRHGTAILSSTAPTVSPPSDPSACRRTLSHRPWRSTPGACRPRPSPAAGNTRTHAHVYDHAVTTPLEPR